MDPTLIIFAALALFLSYRLFNVLGTRGGHEPDEQDRPVLRPVPSSDEAHDVESQPSPAVTPIEKLPGWAKSARETVPDFEPKAFLDGAASAYEMVVEAYASGDLSNVRGFLSPDVAKSFEVAIDGREQAGQTVDLTFVGVDKPDVVSLVHDGDELRAEVRFKSEQVRVVRDDKGEVVEGNAEQVVTINDQWTFTRPAHSRDPNWTLVATGPSEG